MIQFILNNQIIKTSEKSGVTLLDFIREQQQLKGTKIGCREGDCGACTVLVGELNNNNVAYQSITSCISPLGNANGKHIVTVEGTNLPKELNTVQKAMTDNYATQCGFCTPGFVVSMTGYALDDSKSNTCNDAISGNICRCTGYKSIEKAGLEIEEKLEQKDKNHQIEWLINEGFIPNYFKTIPEKLAQLQPKVFEKTGVKVANGTDVYVRHADKMAEEDVHLLTDQNALKGISFTEGICTLGANTTVTEIAENKKLQTLFPKLKQFLKLVSSEQIRNMGTIGGNFVNASPIGDMSIFFLALNSTLTIQKEDDASERQIPFQDFHQDYKKYDLQEGEILKSISFKVPQSNDYFNFEKVSKRTHLDIASVNAAGRVTVDNNIITSAHFSVGGAAATPKYLEKTNAFLIGKTINSETVKEAETVLQSEISPISDVRGASEYKRLLAKQLFFAHFIELFPNEVELKKLIA
ncbi:MULTISPECIES: FAD binding domain-containing protein [unclassified Tenacibaculum]|uniref:FAD binding domain-containing protein n=1 Tax=unclassified Tenacibaculum TaxID=2635139 RepID=UPI001F40038A|nr:MULTISPECIES: FAD binding domain-containing protein [unclassified Tenacibaculum]MCF2874382.1 FAD binding domain-containing protein [Tenacibaculum sp. Cn5-1]MCF2934963.1 FAD binding domain-containing protein [Tenacibaculum sp. Cn5-34]MCG7511173.1 FAD binding domain-containing protein [Tenacibaculum sp. Cn5-46]